MYGPDVHFGALHSCVINSLTWKPQGAELGTTLMEAENKDVMLFDPTAWRRWKGVEIIWRSFVAEAPF